MESMPTETPGVTSEGQLPDWLVGVVVVITILVVAVIVLIITTFVNNRSKNRSGFFSTPVDNNSQVDLESGKLGPAGSSLFVVSLPLVPDSYQDSLRSEHSQQIVSPSCDDLVYSGPGWRNPLFVDDEAVSEDTNNDDSQLWPTAADINGPVVVEASSGVNQLASTASCCLELAPAASLCAPNMAALCQCQQLASDMFVSQPLATDTGGMAGLPMAGLSMAGIHMARDMAELGMAGLWDTASVGTKHGDSGETAKSGALGDCLDSKTERQPIFSCSENDTECLSGGSHLEGVTDCVTGHGGRTRPDNRDCPAHVVTRPSCQSRDAVISWTQPESRPQSGYVHDQTDVSSLKPLRIPEELSPGSTDPAESSEVHGGNGLSEFFSAPTDSRRSELAPDKDPQTANASRGHPEPGSTGGHTQGEGKVQNENHCSDHLGGDSTGGTVDGTASLDVSTFTGAASTPAVAVSTFTGAAPTPAVAASTFTGTASTPAVAVSTFTEAAPTPAVAVFTEAVITQL